MIKKYFELMRFHKPVGIFLLLWPTLWALFSAVRFPAIKNIIIFVLGVIVMRGAGCVMNDIADREFDRHVARTQYRPITTGEIPVKKALLLFSFLCLIAFILVLFTNTLTIVLAFLALCVAMIYPFMKRFTHWPQFVLGIAFSFSIPMAFAAEINHIPISAVILFFANIAWTIAYDTEYALVDREDDLKIGIKSTAILFGKYNPLIIAALQFFMILLLILFGVMQSFSLFYFATLFIAAVFFAYQHYLLSKKAYFQAFLNNQWVGMVVLLGIYCSHFKMRSFF